MIHPAAIRSLEFEALLERIDAGCQTPLGRERVAAIEPLTDLADAVREAGRIAAWVTLLEAGGSLTLGELGDVRAILRAAAKPGVALAGDDLAWVARLLEYTARAERFLAGLPASNLLRSLLVSLPGLAPLRAELSRAIDVDGTVLDGASPELGRLRHESRTIGGRIERAVERFFETQPELKEHIVTIRDTRSVVAIRSDLNPTSYGLVHGRSASGATFYVEPFGLLELNNRTIELRDLERHEVERILRALTAAVRMRLEELEAAAACVGELDFIAARGRLQRRFGPADIAPSADGAIVLEEARHPLLLVAEADPDAARNRVVPLDLELAPAAALVITGPNTGGKTVALKTVGLALLGFAFGLPIAARRARLPLIRSLVVDLGDPQDIAQSLSTFSGHMQLVIAALGNLPQPAVVLLDELGAGTDPREGAAIGVAVVEALRARGVTSLITSHHEPVKRFALTTPWVVPAAVEFDEATLRPTYRLLLNRSGASNALRVADRLGLDAAVLVRARELIAGEQTDLQAAIDGMEAAAGRHDRARAAAETERSELVIERDRLAREVRNLCDREAGLRGREGDVRRRLRAESDARVARILTDLRTEGERIVAGIGASSADAKLVRRTLDKLERQVRGEVRAAVSDEPLPADGDDGEGADAEPVLTGAPVIGDRVRVGSFGVVGRLVELGSTTATVEVSGKRLRVRPSDLTRLNPSREVARVDITTRVADRSAAAPIELNLIGIRVEEALALIDRFLDDAVVANTPRVRIIHGHGTGRLRTGIHGHLREHPHVRAFESEQHGGVTAADLEL